MQIEENKRQSQIIADECLPSWSVSFIMKTILMILTTSNDNPNLGHSLLMAFSDLEKRKHKNFREKKHYAGGRVSIEQKPYATSLNQAIWDQKY